jgi:hypothetical protein
MRLRPFVVALLLPLAVTLATLAAVAWNRSGGRGPIVLTEREVSVTAPTADNTTATLWLAWASERHGATVTSRTQLRQGYAALTLKDDVAPGLGNVAFGAGGVASGPDGVASGRDGVASGGGGVASGFSRKASRLVAVDLDRDAAALARRYPDGRTHIITAATIAVPVDGSFEQGSVVTIEPQRVHVPRQWAGQLATGTFDVELWYGLRAEPWISAIRRRPPP